MSGLQSMVGGWERWGKMGRRRRNVRVAIMTSLVAQWLRLQAPILVDRGLIPGQGTRSYMLQLRFFCATTRKFYMPGLKILFVATKIKDATCWNLRPGASPNKNNEKKKTIKYSLWKSRRKCLLNRFCTSKRARKKDQHLEEARFGFLWHDSCLQT